jgi:hypothetical protein
MLVPPLSLPISKRSVPRIGEGDVEIDDTITAMAIAAAMPNFIAFFMMAWKGSHK